jgi:hypothetical protein
MIVADIIGDMVVGKVCNFTDNVALCLGDGVFSRQPVFVLRKASLEEYLEYWKDDPLTQEIKLWGPKGFYEISTD